LTVWTLREATDINNVEMVTCTDGEEQNVTFSVNRVNKQHYTLKTNNQTTTKKQKDQPTTTTTTTTTKKTKQPVTV